MEIGRKKRVK